MYDWNFYINYGARGELLFRVTTVLIAYISTNVCIASRVKVVKQEGNKLLLLLLYNLILFEDAYGWMSGLMVGLMSNH